MRIVGMYDFKGGSNIPAHYPQEYQDVVDSITQIDSNQHKTKLSAEKTMTGRMLYSPVSLNQAFEQHFVQRNWQIKQRIQCDYPRQYYIAGYQPPAAIQRAYREIDFIKNRLGVEIQFGKYAFMVYNVCAKMTIFHNLGIIDAGIEVVPVKEFAVQMSSGVSYFEQFVWDLEQRGVADIDIPVLILGIAA